MKLSLFCRPHQLPGGDVTLFAEAARLADEFGFYSIHFGEHLIMSERTDRYPFGTFAHPPEAAWPDPLLMLSAAAVVTTTLRLSSGVVLAPLRPAVLLAKQIATLDVISRGRAELGVGVGWQPEEFAAAGVPWEERYGRLDDALRACRVLWGKQPSSFESSSVSFERVRAYPTPVQSRVPLLLGLSPTEKNARRIAEYGDGWCPVGSTPDQVAEGLATLRPAMVSVGRDPDSLIVRALAPPVVEPSGALDVAATLAVASDFRRAGVTVLGVGLPAGLPDIEAMRTVIQRIAETGASTTR